MIYNVNTSFLTEKQTNPLKKGDNDQESIQSSTTSDPVYQWESNKLTIWDHKRERRGQPFPSRWPQGLLS